VDVPAASGQRDGAGGCPIQRGCNGPEGPGARLHSGRSVSVPGQEWVAEERDNLQWRRRLLAGEFCGVKCTGKKILSACRKIIVSPSFFPCRNKNRNLGGMATAPLRRPRGGRRPPAARRDPRHPASPPPGTPPPPPSHWTQAAFEPRGGEGGGGVWSTPTQGVGGRRYLVGGRG